MVRHPRLGGACLCLLLLVPACNRGPDPKPGSDTPAGDNTAKSPPAGDNPNAGQPKGGPPARTSPTPAPEPEPKAGQDPPSDPRPESPAAVPKVGSPEQAAADEFAEYLATKETLSDSLKDDLRERAIEELARRPGWPLAHRLALGYLIKWKELDYIQSGFAATRFKIEIGLIDARLRLEPRYSTAYVKSEGIRAQVKTKESFALSDQAEVQFNESFTPDLAAKVVRVAEYLESVTPKELIDRRTESKGVLRRAVTDNAEAVTAFREARKVAEGVATPELRQSRERVRRLIEEAKKAADRKK